MCEQCCAKTESYGEVFPGWVLVRATVNGMEMRAGQWGLVQFDDPLFIWTETPTILIDRTQLFKEDTPEYDEAVNEWLAWTDKATAFGRFFHISADLGWHLVESAREKGYSIDLGPFNEWFFNYLGEWIRDHEPIPPE